MPLTPEEDERISQFETAFNKLLEIQTAQNDLVHQILVDLNERMKVLESLAGIVPTPMIMEKENRLYLEK